jgi:hypothetical protein
MFCHFFRLEIYEFNILANNYQSFAQAIGINSAKMEPDREKYTDIGIYIFCIVILQIERKEALL